MLAAPNARRDYHLSSERAAKRIRLGDPERCRALEMLASFLRSFASHSLLGRTMIAENEDIRADATSLVAVFEAKKTATLSKRASSLAMYARWFREVGLAGPPFAETRVYRYYEMLIDAAAPATRGQAARQAMHFAGGTLGFDVAAASESPRAKGLCLRLLKTRAPLRQRAPLTVGMVKTLEELVLKDPSSESGLLAGAALFCTYGRARVGDIARGNAEPELDLAPDGITGFVQSGLLDHKTARPGDRKSLPIVAPVMGVSQKPWGVAWISGRRAASLDARCGTLLPAPLTGGEWSSAPMTTFEFGLAVRTLLGERGFSPEDLKDIGAHSLKCTTLSWLAKAGVNRDVRRLLGYHIRKDEKSMEAYSRDSVAGPLRELCSVIAKIQQETFLPDSTRSGRFVDQAASSQGALGQACDDESSSSASSRTSVGSSSAASAVAVDATITHESSRIPRWGSKELSLSSQTSRLGLCTCLRRTGSSFATNLCRCGGSFAWSRQRRRSSALNASSEPLLGEGFGAAVCARFMEFCHVGCKTP